MTTARVEAFSIDSYNISQLYGGDLTPDFTVEVSNIKSQRETQVADSRVEDDQKISFRHGPSKVDQVVVGNLVNNGRLTNDQIHPGETRLYHFRDSGEMLRVVHDPLMFTIR